MAERLIIGHRGASAEAPENTRAAFRKALDQGAEGLETDVQLSADNIPVLWHDDDLGKLGLAGRRVDEFSVRELCAMEGGGWFAPEWTGEPLISLADLLQEFAPHTRLLIEIKQRDDEATERRQLKARLSLALIQAYRGGNLGIEILSFDLPTLIYLHSLDPHQAYILNSEDIATATAVREVLTQQPFLAGLCVAIEHVNSEVAAAVRAAGKRLAVYTCDSDADIDWALNLGVDRLISNVPGYARARRTLECKL